MMTRDEKRQLEYTALHGVKLSDVQFTLKNSAAAAQICGMIAGMGILYGGRFFLKQRITHPDAGLSVTDTIFWILMALLLIGGIVILLRSGKQTGISVSGNTLFCGASSWTSDEITGAKCTRWMETISLYAGGKKILSISWSMENSELLIAWINKCGIPFDDNRLPMSPLT